MNRIRSHIIPLNRSHVDTDQIIPAEFLRSVFKTGYGQHLFANLRAADPHFPFNQEIYHDAKILVAGMNFGCGSSREHAVWSLADWGIQAIIAPSFADIFLQNALNNKLLPIALSETIVEKIFAIAGKQNRCEISIDLPDQTISFPTGEILHFTIDPYKKECLMHGMNDFDYLLSKRQQIAAYACQNQENCFIDTYIVNQLIQARKNP